MENDAQIACGNLFMMCPRLNTAALSEIPDGYHIRTCRRDELDIWKTIHFDDAETAQNQKPYMTRYFETVYEPAGDAFWDRCLFLCTDEDDTPIGTCFAWQAYGRVMTIHWFKIRKAYEGRGLGRALLSAVMRQLAPSDYPVFLHTHPGSFRAIKLYTDFGFALLTDEKIGFRANDLGDALPFLGRMMPGGAYDALRFAAAPDFFLEAAESSPFSQF